MTWGVFEWAARCVCLLLWSHLLAVTATDLGGLERLVGTLAAWELVKMGMRSIDRELSKEVQR